MKAIFVTSLCLMLMAGTAFSTDPQGPIPPGGWGQDCSEWTSYLNPWNSGEMVYDPLAGSGGDGWVYCDGSPVTWPPLFIEMWIEMECVIHWDETAAQVHLASYYDDFYLYFCGGSACNHGQYIITTPPVGGDLDFLPFQSVVAGNEDPSFHTDIPLTWDYSLDGGATYQPMTADTDGSKYFIVPACDQEWCIRVLVDLIYHQGDGYYYLGGDGCYICPAEPL
jgi:hypothetical protein